LRHGLTLQAQPASLNILPLYIVLLALFPLIYGLIAISPIIALLASCAMDLGQPRSIHQPDQLAGRARLVLRPFRLAIPVRHRRARCPAAASVRWKFAAPAMAARRSLGISWLRAGCRGALGHLGVVQFSSDRTRCTGKNRPGAAAAVGRAGSRRTCAQFHPIPRPRRAARTTVPGVLRSQFA
jgi:OpgC protein